MSQSATLSTAVQLPTGFHIDAVDTLHLTRPTELAVTAAPSLGPLAAFKGTFIGTGFNTIFRPDSPQTPTALPTPVTSDNVLELNLTAETLSFSPSLGSVPNRGTLQADTFLNGVPYLQSINDVTIANKSVGIHLEPGLWMAVQPTKDPAEAQSFVRMASIPHGTTVVAQGTALHVAGGPQIAAVDITPFVAATGVKVPFPSQTAANNKTARLPQDLTSFIAAGTITQAMITDPTVVLRDRIAGQKITATDVIIISTQPAKPLFGGGTDNIAFLLGDPNAASPNAQATQMSAIFWIETVEHTITVPIFKLGSPALMLNAEAPKRPGEPVAKFLVQPPVAITAPKQIKVQSTQIQYVQTVLLNFKNLLWPHVSVATLVPAELLPVPPTVWH